MMNTYVETNYTTKVGGTDLHYLQRASSESDVGKKKWLRKYSRRLLRLWLQRQTPLGVAPVYIGQIEEDLANFYDEPLKRVFIETTYD
jgi:hypothetical protein